MSTVIQAVIVEDEENSRKLLQLLVEQNCPQIEITGSATNVTDGIRLIEQKRPGLVFLDIEMPVDNGFKLIDHFDPVAFGVIFTTAYNEYAIKAFKYSAVDYLLKPISVRHLVRSVGKFLKSVDLKNSTKKYHLLKENLNNNLTKIALPTSSGYTSIPLNTIIRLEGEHNYTYFHFSDKEKILVTRTLKEYEELLSNSNFFRIHKSHLINLNFVKEYVRGDGGYVLMEDGAALSISRRRREEFVKLLKG